MMGDNNNAKNNTNANANTLGFMMYSILAALLGPAMVAAICTVHTHAPPSLPSQNEKRCDGLCVGSL
jgi:hypothetical protein